MTDAEDKKFKTLYVTTGQSASCQKFTKIEDGDSPQKPRFFCSGSPSKLNN